jgi:hypothetical protein
LNLRYTPTALSFAFFHFLVGGEYDEATGQYLTPAGTGGGAARGGSGGNTGGGDGGHSGSSSCSPRSGSIPSWGGPPPPGSIPWGASPAASTLARGGEEPVRRAYVMNEMCYHPQLPSMHHAGFFSM